MALSFTQHPDQVRRDIVFATISLHKMAGGLERNIIRIANHMADIGHRVKIVTFDFADAESFYAIDQRVEWIKTGATQPHKKISFTDRLKLIARMRAAFPRNGIIVAFHHGLLARIFLASFGLGNRIICSERNALALYDHIRAKKWNLNFLLMAFVSKITVQFDSYRRDYPFFMRPKIVAIPNVVEPAQQLAQPASISDDGRFRLLAVGRLCDQKNYPVLIDAFAALSSKFPDWDLSIVGDGSLQSTLQNQIDGKGMVNRIFLEGKSADVSTWYARSHLFVMPSKWEGFPNALAEALAHGLPAVGFAASAGVRDLIEDGVNGILAAGQGDVSSLIAALTMMMGSAEKRELMGANAQNTMARYDARSVYAQWATLFQDL